MSDETTFNELAARAEANGDPILAGIYRAEAGNDRTNWVKHHRPCLGPYEGSNPRVCVDCGVALGEPVETWLSAPCQGSVEIVRRSVEG
jgi:hypothetical protein